MKYIDLMNSFWRYYDENKDKLSVSDITLYFTLLRYCNKLGWINPFNINPYLMAEINPLSINTYYKSLKNLDNLKLIEWKPGKNNVSNAKITILKFNTSVVTSVNNSIDTSIVNSVDNSVVSNNKTIILLDYKTIIQSKEFKKFLISSNYKLIKIDEEETPKIIFPFTSLEFIKFWDLWKEYKQKEFKFKYKSAISEQASLKSLNDLSGGQEQIALKIIEQSIANNWKGFFKLKNNNDGTNKQNNKEEWDEIGSMLKAKFEHLSE
jgi:hypothetical protein